MLSFEDLNWLAIVVAALAYFAVGSVWYQPKVLGAMWMKATGVDPNRDPPNPLIFVGTLVVYFLMAMVLAMIARGADGSSFADGLVLGLLTGVVFIAAQAWVNAAYEGRSASMVLVNGGIGVLGHVVAAVIVTAWA